VKVDLIIGLPGDTRDSVRRSLHYLRESSLCDEVQVFNLAVLPGTAFRQEAGALGLEYQPRPPYYVLKTPTLDLTDLYALMEEAQELFETEFDPLPEPRLPERFEISGASTASGLDGIDRQARPTWCIDLDAQESAGSTPGPEELAQAVTLWLRGDDFRSHERAAVDLVERLLAANPHTTLQIILEPGNPISIRPGFLADLQRACYRRTNYLDWFYSILPGAMKGSKRIVLALDEGQRDLLQPEQQAALEEFAEILRTGILAVADQGAADRA
jgi:hypothetical protein